MHFWLTRQRPWLVFAVFAYLFITSFYSYFSSWRGPLTILIVSALVNYREFKPSQILSLTPSSSRSSLSSSFGNPSNPITECSFPQGKEGKSFESADLKLSRNSRVGNNRVKEDRLFDNQTVEATYKRRAISNTSMLP